MSKGRPKLYDVSHLAVGESTIIPWREENGTHLGVNQKPIYNAVLREEKRAGKKFDRTGRGLGVVVTRIK